MEKTDMVSIIITTYNSAENLRRTLNSIEMQDYPAIQVCIKDGGSKDGTVSVIREYEHSSRFPVIWSSGADEGIYDAMNHGYSPPEKSLSFSVISFCERMQYLTW